MSIVYCLQMKRAMSEEEICEKAKIFKKQPLKPYQLEVNKAACEICVKDPTMLLRPRDELMQQARQAVHDSGYEYAKKRSRSKHFGSESGSEPPVEKRAKMSTEMRHQRIAQISEELKSLNTQISFKEERIKKGVQSRDFKLCDYLSDEVDNLQARRREREIELLKLEKEERAKKYLLQKKVEKEASLLSPSSSDSEHLFTPVKGDNAVQDSSTVPLSLSSPTSLTRPCSSRSLFSPPISFSGRISSLKSPGPEEVTNDESEQVSKGHQLSEEVANEHQLSKEVMKEQQLSKEVTKEQQLSKEVTKEQQLCKEVTKEQQLREKGECRKPSESTSEFSDQSF